MRGCGLSAIAFLLTIAAPLPTFAYTQEDADACTPDAMRLCMEAIPDENRVAQCLVKNKAQLAPACAAVFDRASTANATPISNATNTSRHRPARVQATKF